jgi:hypothetical protein
MSVVDGMGWEGLKRYNVTELYKLATSEAKAKANNSAQTGSPPDMAEAAGTG